jgi:serine/threonine protein kinase
MVRPTRGKHDGSLTLTLPDEDSANEPVARSGRVPVSSTDRESDHGSVRYGATRYLLERKLGEGSMGAVYFVRDASTREPLALKRLFNLDAKSVLRLKREFRSLVDLSHPNLVKLYELGRDEDGWFLLMEFVDGDELWEYLTRQGEALELDLEHGQADPETLLDCFRQLALGIDALHQAGLLHRDLKPSNVMVSSGQVKVLDFGLVRELDTASVRVTDAGQVAGTPAYMAPEQASGAM